MTMNAHYAAHRMLALDLSVVSGNWWMYPWTFSNVRLIVIGRNHVHFGSHCCHSSDHCIYNTNLTFEKHFGTPLLPSLLFDCAHVPTTSVVKAVYQQLVLCSSSFLSKWVINSHSMGEIMDPSCSNDYNNVVLRCFLPKVTIISYPYSNYCLMFDQQLPFPSRFHFSSWPAEASSSSNNIAAW